MRIRTRYTLFKGLMALGVLVFAASLYDMFANEADWQFYILAAYALLIVLALVLYIGHKPKIEEDILTEQLPADAPQALPVEEEIAAAEIVEIPKQRAYVPASSMGPGHHFRCPFCSNLFELAATHARRTKDFRMNCPYCANSIRVPARPKVAPGDLAAFRSAAPDERVHYACRNCGEVLQFTAPGSRLERALRVATCPQCSSRQVTVAAAPA